MTRMEARAIRPLFFPPWLVGVLVSLLLACGKKPADVEGVWEVDIDASTESIAKDAADLNLDPRIQRIKSMARGLVPPGDRAEIVQARKMELRPILTDLQMEVDFRADGSVVVSSMKNGVRETKAPENWSIVDGKVAIGGGSNAFTFEGKLLKGRLFDGHPGAVVLRKR